MTREQHLYVVGSTVLCFMEAILSPWPRESERLSPTFQMSPDVVAFPDVRLAKN